MEEDERVELIGGELVPMSPKGNQHEVVKSALVDRWYRSRPDDCRLTRKRPFASAKTPILNPTSSSIRGRVGSEGSRARNVLLVVEIADFIARATTSAARRRSTQASAFASFG